MAGWRDAWWRKTLRGVLHRDADAGRQQANRGHSFFGKKRWDDALHKRTDIEVEQPWQFKA